MELVRYPWRTHIITVIDFFRRGVSTQADRFQFMRQTIWQRLRAAQVHQFLRELAVLTRKQ